VPPSLFFLPARSTGRGKEGGAGNPWPLVSPFCFVSSSLFQRRIKEVINISSGESPPFRFSAFFSSFLGGSFFFFPFFPLFCLAGGGLREVTVFLLSFSPLLSPFFFLSSLGRHRKKGRVRVAPISAVLPPPPPSPFLQVILHLLPPSPLFQPKGRIEMKGKVRKRRQARTFPYVVTTPSYSPFFFLPSRSTA